MGAHVEQPSSSTSAEQPAQLQIQLKLLHALQSLGCLHVAQAFVRSLPEEALRRSPQLSEAHYEAGEHPRPIEF